MKNGDRVLLLLRPNAQMFAMTFAIVRIGAVPVLIDPGMGYKAMVQAFSKIRIDAFIGENRAHLLRLLFLQHFF